MELLSPKMDFIFKQIFGSEENKEVLVSFLNAVLKPTNDNIITEVSIKNTDVEKEYITDKFSRLDVLATTNRKETINIEIQLKNEQNMIKRSLYYWSKLYTKPLSKGEDYDLLNRTVCINILDFNYLKKTSNFHSVFRLKEIFTNMELTDVEEIHFIELPKLSNNKEKDLLTSWCEFLNNPESEEVRNSENNIIEIKTAKNKLIKISSNDEQRRLYELRKKRLLDERSALNRAKKQEAIKIAKNLLDVLDDEIISLKTGLTIEEVKKLR
ncbi:Rpn family recombination-promoting nuclease/putative transposase [Clostridium massiliamazoniense]|uniref:Rpn family recombination-promoting nuclease/putative transposase n=1 Tax=Clostridium massiliamazoniense TaxID=1347366 RepID=UPI0006D7AF19|nr:Rpn family recombination-promoting nuclease/putative transposase [Clostridium massiliamazoniense]